MRPNYVVCGIIFLAAASGLPAVQNKLSQNLKHRLANPVAGSGPEFGPGPGHPPLPGPPCTINSPLTNPLALMATEGLGQPPPWLVPPPSTDLPPPGPQPIMPRNLFIRMPDNPPPKRPNPGPALYSPRPEGGNGNGGDHTTKQYGHGENATKTASKPTETRLPGTNKNMTKSMTKSEKGPAPTHPASGMNKGGKKGGTGHNMLPEPGASIDPVWNAEEAGCEICGKRCC